MNRKHVPEGEELSAELQKLSAGSPVLAYRLSSKSWEGPFKSVRDRCCLISAKKINIQIILCAAILQLHVEGQQ